MKKTSLFENALIWFGAGVSIAEILTGTYLAPLGLKMVFWPLWLDMSLAVSYCSWLVLLVGKCA